MSQFGSWVLGPPKKQKSRSQKSQTTNNILAVQRLATITEKPTTTIWFICAADEAPGLLHARQTLSAEQLIMTFAFLIWVFIPSLALLPAFW